MQCNFSEFKLRCKQLRDAAQDLDDAGLQNGIKKLSISFLTMSGTAMECREASLALGIVLRQVDVLRSPSHPLAGLCQRQP